jgi:hypothetical protein
VTVTCPNCGWNEARQIAPGYWECQEPDYVADGRGRDAACRHRFHARDAAAVTGEMHLCACGTIAIGQCLECHRWVCGDHSDLWPGRGRLCLEDIAPLRKAIDEEQQRGWKAQAEKAQAKRVELEASIEKERSDQRSARLSEAAVLAVGALVLYLWLGSQNCSDAARMAVAGAVAAVAIQHARYAYQRTNPEPKSFGEWVAIAFSWGLLGAAIGAIIGAFQ